MSDKKKINFEMIISVFQFIVSSIFLYFVYQFPMLSLKWKLAISGVVLLLLIITSLLFMKGKKGKVALVTTRMFALLLSVLLIVSSLAMPVLTDTFKNVIKNPETSGTLNMVVFANKDLDTSAENMLFDGDLAIVDKVDIENQQYAVNYINKSFKKEVKTKSYASLMESVKALYNKEVKYLLLNESYITTISDSDEYSDFLMKYKIVYTVEKPVTFEGIVKSAKVTEEPFNIFINGSDYYGKIEGNGRSDVNMVVSVNPKTKQVLLTSLPRDSYVKLPGFGYAYDKLTHASIYGVDESIAAVENLLDIDINYYVRINFSSVMDIVNVLGGIDVNNPYEFRAFFEGYDEFFEKGILHLDGYRTLCYVRERKSLPKGDEDRNVHQQIALQAMLDKIISPQMISKFSSFLSTISNSFITNMNTNEIFSIIQMQMDDMASWNIVSQALQGGNATEPTYSMGSRELSVVKLYKSHISQAKEQIGKVFNGETVEYKEMP
ncbi:MAG: LCP family protein [Erysipelotrichaceae bacterium]